jgi:O-antigen/teichoic acid export membrane protein
MGEVASALRSRVGRNALLNLAGFGIPLVVAAFALPVLTQSLGPARFGLLGMSWAFLEYLTLFDVGLGKATVRYVADAVARRTSDIPQIAAVSLATQVALGAVAAVTLAGFSSMLAQRAFHVEPALVYEATALFVVVAANLPVVLALTTLRGVLEGAQHFGISNAIKIPASAGSIVIPAVLASYGVSLPSIMMWVLAWRVIACIVTLIAIRRTVSGFRIEMPRDWKRLRGLISFGGWVAISGIVSPILVYFDRFALGVRVNLTAVGYYTAPYEGITRALVIPNSLINALFPLLTGLGVAAAVTRIDRLFSSSMRMVLILMSVPTAIAFIFAPLILRLWMGADYALQGALPLRILAVGVLINAVAHIPYTFLEASGRPDVPAKCHLFELVIHLPVAWMLVGKWGIVGAAIAWTLRVTLDTLLLLVAARNIIPVSLTAIITGHRPSLTPVK